MKMTPEERKFYDEELTWIGKLCFRFPILEYPVRAYAFITDVVSYVWYRITR